jgi:hypothetical protein
VDQELFPRDQNSTSKEEIDLIEMAQREEKEEVVDQMVTEEEVDLMATEEATEEVDHKEDAMKEGEAQEVVKNHF